MRDDIAPSPSRTSRPSQPPSLLAAGLLLLAGIVPSMAAAVPAARSTVLVPAFAASLRASTPAASALGPRKRHHDQGLYGVAFASVFVPQLTVTKSDQLIGDDGDGEADPGETIRYTVEIANDPAAMDATGVVFTDTVDPNTTVVAGSENASPIAFDAAAMAATGPVTITLTGSDGDGDALTFEITSGPTQGSVDTTTPAPTSATTADVVYTPPAVPAGPTDTFTFKVNDGTVDSNEEATVTITIDNPAPVLTITDTSTLTYTEEDPPLPITDDLTVSDNGDIASATVSITAGFETSQDVLAATASGAIGAGDISYNGGAGVLTIAPAAPASTADFQAVLRSVTYENTSMNPTKRRGASAVQAGTRTISFQVTDDGVPPPPKPSNVVSRDVDVVPVNDPPVVTTTPGVTAFVEDGGAVAVDGGVTVTDVDNATLASATVTITNVQDGAAEQLAAPGCGTLTVAGAGTSSLSISGVESPANYQACLQSVTYENTSEDPTESPDRSIEFVVNDGMVNSSAATKAVSVTAVNDPPVADDETFDDVPVNVLLEVQPAASGAVAVHVDDNVLTGDTDVDSATLTVSEAGGDATAPFVFTTAEGGSVTMQSDGTFTYISEVGEDQPSDTFDYTVSDGEGGTDTGTVTINFTASTIWFIDATPAAAPKALAGTGQSNDPFTDIASFNAATTGTDDVIFVHAGTYTDDGIDLLDNQQLIGEEEGLTDGGLTIAAGTAPVLAPTMDNAVNLASGNTVRGLNVGNTPAGHAFSGGAVGTPTISNVEVSGTGGILEVTTSGDLTGVGFDAQASTSTAAGDAAIDLTGISGTYGGGSPTISGSSDAGLSINNSTGSFTFGSVSINNTTGGGVSLTNNAGGSISFTGGLDIDTGTGLGFNASGGGTVNVTGTAGEESINTTSGKALDLDGVTAGITFDSISSNGSGSEGIDIDNVGGTFTVSGTTTITSPTTRGVDINGASGTFTFSDLDITTTNVTGLFATNSGTVNSSSGTINTGTATGVDIDNTNLGLTFTSITSSGGSAPGIDLRTTTGSFTVDGDGINTSLGGNGSGGTIANKTGANGSSNGVGVFLDNAAGVALRRMQLNNFDNFAIRGTTVTGFTLANATVNTTSGFNGNSAADDEGSVSFDDLLGTASFTGSIISQGHEDNIVVTNTAMGSTLNMSVTNSRIGLNNLNDGILVETQNNAVLNLSVTGTAFLGADGDHIQCNALDTSTMDCTIQDNTFTNTHPSSLGSGVTISGGSAMSNITMTYDISGTTPGAQTFNGSVGSAITVNPTNGAGTVTGTIENNKIGTSGVANSGSSGGGAGIAAGCAGSLTHFTTINNNDIDRVNGTTGAIDLNTQISCTLNATITDNVVNELDGFTFAALYALSGGANATDTAHICADIRSNTFDGSASFGFDVFLDQLGGSTSSYNFPGYVGPADPPASPNALDAFLSGQNTLVQPFIDSGSTQNVTGTGTACPTAPPSMQARNLGSNRLVAPGATVRGLLEGMDVVVPSSSEGSTRSGIAASGRKVSPAIVEPQPPEPVATPGEARPARRLHIPEQAGHPAEATPLDVVVEERPMATLPLEALAAMRPPPADDAAPVQIAEAAPSAAVPQRPRRRRPIERRRPPVAEPESVPLASSENDVGSIAGMLEASEAMAQLPTLADIKAAFPAVRGVSGRLQACVGGTCTWTLGTLPAGRSVTIVFDVVVNDPVPAGVEQVANQGTLTADGGLSVDSDDPDVGGAADPTVTPVVAEPDLTLAKDDGGLTAVPGQTIPYTLSYDNAGNQGATGVVLTETVPVGTTSGANPGWEVGTVGSGTACDGQAPGTTCVFDVGALPGGGAAPATAAFNVVVDNPAGTDLEQIDNAASIADDGANGADPNPGDNDATDTTPVNAAPSITGTLADALQVDTDADGEVDPGDTIRYTAVVSNDGDQDASMVVFTDAPDANTTLVVGSVTTTQGTIVTGNTAGDATVEVDLTTVDGEPLKFLRRATATITFDVVVNVPFPTSAQSVQTQGTIAFDTFEGGPPPATAQTVTDDPDTPAALDPTVTPIDVTADLRLTKTASTATPDFGAEVTFEIIVTNDGPSDPFVVVTDLLPAGLAYVSDDGGGAYDPADGTWEVGRLPAGDSATLHLTARVEGLVPVVNAAEVTVASLPDPDSTPGDGTGDDYAEVTITPVAADLAVKKDLMAILGVEGDGVQADFVFQITITNQGPSDATGVAITDEVLAAVHTFVSAAASQGGYDPATGVWTVGDVAEGATAVLTLTIRAHRGADTFNYAEVTASDQPDQDPSNNVGVDFVGRLHTPGSFTADLELTKTVDEEAPDVGDLITYTLTVVNRGPDRTAGVEVTDRLPEGVEFVSARAGTPIGHCPGCGYDDATGAWTVGPLPVGDSLTLEIVVRVTGEGTITNTAEVTGSHLPDPDSLPGDLDATQDDTDAATVTVGSGKATPIIRAEAGEIPARYELAANYPNPFNPETVIPFGVPAPAHVRLEVFDLLGRRVTVLVDEALAAGRHEAIWQATNQPTGVYLVRLVAGSFIETRRLSLIK